MATGNIGGKKNYAKTNEATSVSASTAADTTTVTVTYTNPALGPEPRSYLFTASSTGDGATTPVTAIVTQSGTSITGMSSNKLYSFTLQSRGYNGTGGTSTPASVTIPAIYGLLQTFNSTTTYTIPNSVSKISAYVIGAGGGGGASTGGGPHSSPPYPGRGGGGGGVVFLTEFNVTGGSTIGITVGAGGAAGNGTGVQGSSNQGPGGSTGGTSKITYSGIDIGTSAGGGGGGQNNQNGEGPAGVGGSGSSNIATNSFTGTGGGEAASSNFTYTPNSSNISTIFPSANLISGGVRGGTSNSQNSPQAAPTTNPAAGAGGSGAVQRSSSGAGFGGSGNAGTAGQIIFYGV